jgi:hypothetical protein
VSNSEFASDEDAEAIHGMFTMPGGMSRAPQIGLDPLGVETGLRQALANFVVSRDVNFLLGWLGAAAGGACLHASLRRSLSDCYSHTTIACALVTDHESSFSKVAASALKRIFQVISSNSMDLHFIPPS